MNVSRCLLLNAALVAGVCSSSVAAEAASQAPPTPPPAPPELVKEIAVPADATHVTLVVDFSGSMRDSSTDNLHPAVVQIATELLARASKARYFQIVDADGRYVLRPSGWFENTATNRASAIRSLARYRVDNVSDPIPGLARALSALSDPNIRMFVCVIGDELASARTASQVLNATMDLNRIDAAGRPRATISAIRLPTLEGWDPKFIDNSPQRFEEAMVLLAASSGGTYAAIKEETFWEANRRGLPKE